MLHFFIIFIVLRRHFHFLSPTLINRVEVCIIYIVPYSICNEFWICTVLVAYDMVPVIIFIIALKMCNSSKLCRIWVHLVTFWALLIDVPKSLTQHSNYYFQEPSTKQQYQNPTFIPNQFSIFFSLLWSNLFLDQKQWDLFSFSLGFLWSFVLVSSLH